jgi:hypothetical protein
LCEEDNEGSLVSCNLSCCKVLSLLISSNFSSLAKSLRLPCKCVSTNCPVALPISCSNGAASFILNGDKLDLFEIQLLETRMIGDRDTHILNLKGIKRPN